MNCRMLGSVMVLAGLVLVAHGVADSSGELQSVAVRKASWKSLTRMPDASEDSFYDPSLGFHLRPIPAHKSPRWRLQFVK